MSYVFLFGFSPHMLDLELEQGMRDNHQYLVKVKNIRYTIRLVCMIGMLFMAYPFRQAASDGQQG